MVDPRVPPTPWVPATHRPRRSLLASLARLATVAGLALVLWAPAFEAAWAKEAPAAAADPELEKRTLALAAELRCLVCQNQTIADSDAGLAVDLRNQVREMLRAGKTREEITTYMTERYGDFVLYRPPVKPQTALLWYGPPALLLVACFSLWWVLRSRSRLPADQFEADEDDGADAPASPSPAQEPAAGSRRSS